MKDFKYMDYSKYVGLVRETNRPSGGIKTVQRVCVNAFISKESKVLEIGANTGFTALTIARLTGASVVGVDLVEESILEAQRRAMEENLPKVDFVYGSATKLPFQDKSFDHVWLSNVLTFIEDKYRALKECFRIMKPNGFLVFIPIYYRNKPPKAILKKVESAIGTKINIQSKEQWLRLVRMFPVPTEIVYQEDFKYLNVEDQIADYLKEVFNKKHLIALNKDERKKLFSEGTYFMKLFNENLQYAGYSIFIVQKRVKFEERELFLTEPI